MSVGVYGITKGADFVPGDHAEVWLSYRENRTVKGDGFALVETEKYLEAETVGENQIGGLYQLKLPLDTFNKVGIYNIYIRPKQIEATIQDIGVLSAYPEIRGIVLNTSTLGEIDNTNNNELTGYRIEYYDDSNRKKNNFFRIVTSNNKCEPTNQNTNGIISYRFNDNSNLTFLTVTPSSASNSRPLSLPYIGSPQDRIILSNTFFNPELIEIEMTNNDIDSIYNSLNGNQVRTLDSGLVTTFDDNNNIIKQVEHYIIKENATGTPVYEIKENKTNIDFSQDFENITSTV